jgi:hypothetical protein
MLTFSRHGCAQPRNFALQFLKRPLSVGALGTLALNRLDQRSYAGKARGM